MKKLFFLMSMLFVVVFTSVSLAGKTQKLTRDVLVVDAEKNSTVIVLSEKPTVSAQFAAKDLQYHLEKITGKMVPVIQEPAKSPAPIKIAVGNTRIAQKLGFPVDKLAPWEFLVAEKNGTIILAGGDKPLFGIQDWRKTVDVRRGNAVGSCYAVYEFLENYCGVHWYLPSEAGMVFPSSKTLRVKMGDPIRRSTDFKSTSFYPPYFNKKMYWRLGSKPVSFKDMLSTAEFFLWQLRNKVGGEQYMPSHSFANWIIRFGLTHPEWFSFKTKEKIEQILAKGKEKAEKTFNSWGQPCLTAPGVFEQQVADARDYFKNGHTKRRYRGSNGRFFGIGLNDHAPMCRCPSCKALYHRPTVVIGNGASSFYLWDFVNRTAREIRKTNPGKWVAAIAYSDYTVPPANFTLEPNVAVTVCATGSNWIPKPREKLYRLLNAWRNNAKAQWIGLWEYFVFQRQITGVPRSAPRFLGEDVKKVYKLGVVAEFIENWAHAEPGAKKSQKNKPCWVGPIRNYLNVWIRFKLRDDTRRDVDKLLNEHYKLFYGPASDSIKQFFELIEDRVNDMSLRGAKTFSNERSTAPKIDWEYLCPPKIMKKLRSFIDDATKRAIAEPYKTRVGWVRKGIMEAMEEEQASYFEKQKNAPSPKQMETVGYFLKKAPVIDGNGGDAAWAKLPLNFLSEYKTGEKSKIKTTFKIGYDNKNLYMLFNCDDPDVKDIKADHDADANVWQDDCVELFLCFDPEKRQAAHIIVNAAGTVQDAKLHYEDDIYDLRWNAQIVTKTKIHSLGYTVELKIPLKELGCPSVKNGLVFFGNFCREKYSGSSNGRVKNLQSWSPTPEGFKDRGGFGRILLTSGDAWHVFFSKNKKMPNAVLYADSTNSTNRRTPVPDGMKVIAEQDHIRLQMNCPAKKADTKQFLGKIKIKLDQPVDISKYPYVEIRFRNKNKSVKGIFHYGYVGEDGAQDGNFFVFSQKGNSSAAQTFIWDINKGNYRKRVKPKLINKIWFYIPIVSPNQTAMQVDFSLYSIRFCKETIRGVKPKLIPAASGLH